MPRHSCWRERVVDAEAVRLICNELDLSPLMARILVARGLQDPQAARKFLDPRLGDLEPPDRMAGLSVAADRLGRAVLDGEMIGIFGDYDVDGISSSALLGDYLRRSGAQISLRVATRQEGYGFGIDQARELANRGCSLLVLVDCGSSDHEAVNAASDAGVDVLAVDHHQITRGSWPGLALVNPQRPDCEFPFKDLTTVGLCFYLVARLRRYLERHDHKAPDPRECLDLVALGTIADVAPLVGQNRILVSRGLIQLGRTRRPGLRELMRLCNMTWGKMPSSDEVGWRLGPRLNAPGRLGDAAVSLDCLWLDDEKQGILQARQCDALNEERRAIQARVQREALGSAQAQADRGLSFILASKDEWHPGVIGIVASSLVTAFRRPAAVISMQDGEGKGSARSVPGVDLVQLLQPCSDLLIRFGGHAAAAGFSVAAEQLDALHQRLDQLTVDRLAGVEEQPLEVDGRLDLDRVDRALCQGLQKLAPFGCGNPEPVFVTSGVEVKNVQVVGRDHLALDLSDKGADRPAIGFGMLDDRPRCGQRIEVAFVPEIDEYRDRVRLRLVDLWPEGESHQER